MRSGVSFVDLLEVLERVKAAHLHVETANMPEWLEGVEDALEAAGHGTSRASNIREF